MGAFGNHLDQGSLDSSMGRDIKEILRSTGGARHPRNINLVEKVNTMPSQQII